VQLLRSNCALGGFPSPAAARYLEVYMSGLNSLSEGCHGAVFSSPGVPEPDKMAPLEVGLPRGPQGRAFELKVPIIYVNCLRSFNIEGFWEGAALAGQKSVLVRTWSRGGLSRGVYGFEKNCKSIRQTHGGSRARGHGRVASRFNGRVASPGAA
jgi:hypothetical protein